MANRNKATIWGARLAVAAILGSAGAAWAQNGTLATLYRGETRQTAGMTVRSLGSGMAEESQNVHFNDGTSSLRITTHGLYQGAGVGFATPVNLSNYLTNRNAFLQFAILLPGTESGGSSFPGGGGGAPPGSFGGYGGKGGAGRARGFAQASSTTINNLRVVLATTGGKTLEFLIPTNYASNEGSWKLMSISLAKIPGLTPDDAQIKEARLFGDVPGTLYLGSIRVVADDAPITIEPISDQPFIPRAERDRYRVVAKGGTTPLKISWDWDASDGIQDESQGAAPTHAFYRGNRDYVVTVTASDVYGIKASAKRTFKVHVSQ